MANKRKKEKERHLNKMIKNISLSNINIFFQI